MIVLLIRWMTALLLAYLFGRAASRLHLPSILGWLLAGMVLGPCAVALMNESLVQAAFYRVPVKILECAVGFMIGTELVWRELKKTGRALIVTTLAQSIGTYLTVSLVFSVIFHFMGLPLYLAFLFGAVALATAPAPALSIVQEFKTSGPVTNTLIPMAALDDIVGVIFFFSTLAAVVSHLSGGAISLISIPIMIVLPFVIGTLPGLLAGFILRRCQSRAAILATLLPMIGLCSVLGYLGNRYLLPAPLLNFMLIGMSFSAVFANLLRADKLEQVNRAFEPILMIAMIIVIVDLGAPLDYKAIAGAGVLSFVYIAARAIGKYSFARLGAGLCRMPQTVRRYLGFVLLPHSGVSLVFTGITATVLRRFEPRCALLIQGTIAAAAILNEIIAVLLAKKAFEWAGEADSARAES